MQPTAELLSPNSLATAGRTFKKGIPQPVDFDTAHLLEDNPRFKVTGLNTRAAVDHAAVASRPVGDELTLAIREAADGLNDDDDSSFDRNGHASHHAISLILGYPVTVHERDKAMGLIQKPERTRAAQPAGRLDTAEGTVETTGRTGSLTFKGGRPSPAAKEAAIATMKAKDAAGALTVTAKAPAEVDDDPSTAGALAS